MNFGEARFECAMLIGWLWHHIEHNSNHSIRENYASVEIVSRNIFHSLITLESRGRVRKRKFLQTLYYNRETT
jgi:hypothetical protein